jgi:hypothetical protein
MTSTRARARNSGAEWCRWRRAALRVTTTFTRGLPRECKVLLVETQHKGLFYRRTAHHRNLTNGDLSSKARTADEASECVYDTWKSVHLLRCTLSKSAITRRLSLAFPSETNCSSFHAEIPVLPADRCCGEQRMFAPGCVKCSRSVAESGSKCWKAAFRNPPAWSELVDEFSSAR